MTQTGGTKRWGTPAGGEIHADRRAPGGIRRQPSEGSRMAHFRSRALTSVRGVDELGESCGIKLTTRPVLS
jgi:hypothetical protein